jgi:hypothetical protein
MVGEATVNSNASIRTIWLMVGLAMLATLSACSSSGSAQVFNPQDNPPDSSSEIQAEKSAYDAALPEADTLPVSELSHTEADMLPFNGEVFVATSAIISDLWLQAGWSIGDDPIDTDTQEVPLDCVLYPHLGVENQWVGSCSGKVWIPKNGAKHIAVMLTGSNGETTMVQVAPPPSSP